MEAFTAAAAKLWPRPTSHIPSVVGLAELLALAPDAEQRGMLAEVFKVGPDGKAANREVELAGRRGTVSGALQLCVLNWLFLMDEPLVVWSTARPDAAHDVLIDVRFVIDASAELRQRVGRINATNGGQEVKLVNGCRLVVRPRWHGKLHGFSASKVIVDQANQDHPDLGHVRAMLAGARDPQAVYGFPV